MDFSDLLAAADGKTVSVSSILLLCFGAAMVWKYIKGFSQPPAKPEIRLSSEAWNEVKARQESHETRISRIEGRLNMPGGDHVR